MSLQALAAELAKHGRFGDSMLIHVAPAEVAGLAALAGGSLPINPKTGLPEAFFFLPFLAGLFGAAAPAAAAAAPAAGATAGLGALGGGIAAGMEAATAALPAAASAAVPTAAEIATAAAPVAAETAAAGVASALPTAASTALPAVAETAAAVPALSAPASAAGIPALAAPGAGALPMAGGAPALAAPTGPGSLAASATSPLFPSASTAATVGGPTAAGQAAGGLGSLGGMMSMDKMLPLALLGSQFMGGGGGGGGKKKKDISDEKFEGGEPTFPGEDYEPGIDAEWRYFEPLNFAHGGMVPGYADGGMIANGPMVAQKPSSPPVANRPMVANTGPAIANRPAVAQRPAPMRDPGPRPMGDAVAPGFNLNAPRKPDVMNLPRIDAPVSPTGLPNQPSAVEPMLPPAGGISATGLPALMSEVAQKPMGMKPDVMLPPAGGISPTGLPEIMAPPMPSSRGISPTGMPEVMAPPQPQSRLGEVISQRPPMANPARPMMNWESYLQQFFGGGNMRTGYAKGGMVTKCYADGGMVTPGMEQMPAGGLADLAAPINMPTGPNAAGGVPMEIPTSPLPSKQIGSPFGQTEEGGSDDELIAQTVEAIRGNHPDPQGILLAFIKTFGEDALKDLVARVRSGAPQGETLQSDGRSDSVPALIDGVTPAALSEGEYVIPADVVSGLGRGSTDSGARKLDAMVGQVRMASGGMVPGVLTPTMPKFADGGAVPGILNPARLDGPSSSPTMDSGSSGEAGPSADIPPGSPGPAPVGVATTPTMTSMPPGGIPMLLPSQGAAVPDPGVGAPQGFAGGGIVTLAKAGLPPPPPPRGGGMRPAPSAPVWTLPPRGGGSGGSPFSGLTALKAMPPPVMPAPVVSRPMSPPPPPSDQGTGNFWDDLIAQPSWRERIEQDPEGFSRYWKHKYGQYSKLGPVARMRMRHGGGSR